MPKTSNPFIDEEGEVRPLRAKDKITATPLRDSFPELAEYAAEREVGRPKSANPKRLQSFKLSSDLIAAIRSSGRGYNVRVEQILRDAWNEGRLS